MHKHKHKHRNKYHNNSKSNNNNSNLESTQIVVDYAIAFSTAAPWVMGVILGDALPKLSYHCPLLLSLALLSAWDPAVSVLPTLYARWDKALWHAGRPTSAPRCFWHAYRRLPPLVAPRLRWLLLTP